MRKEKQKKEQEDEKKKYDWFCRTNLRNAVYVTGGKKAAKYQQIVHISHMIFIISYSYEEVQKKIMKFFNNNTIDTAMICLLFSCKCGWMHLLSDHNVYFLCYSIYLSHTLDV